MTIADQSPTGAPPSPRWNILITAADGTQLRWRKAGAVHTLSPDLGPIWVANFKPALFQVAPDGTLVARGSDSRAQDIVSVALIQPG